MVVKITDFAGFAAEWLPRPLVYCFAQANALWKFATKMLISSFLYMVQ